MLSAAEGNESATYDPVTSDPAAVVSSVAGTVVTAAAGVSDSNLTIAQQAVAAFEAGGGLQADFGADQYLSVIGEDGQEIRVQIVRKEAEDGEALPPNTHHQLEVRRAICECGIKCIHTTMCYFGIHGHPPSMIALRF